MIVIIVFGTFVLVFGLCLIVLQRFSAALTWFRFRDYANVRRNLPYIEGSTDPKHRLDVYIPKGKKDFPIVHFIHGGYWISGDKNYRPRLSGLYDSIGLALTSRGIGCVISNYRLAPKVAINDQLHDVQAAVHYTQRSASGWGGNGQVSLMGHSAGGHIISLLLDEPSFSDIKSFIALSPILDVEGMAASQGEQFNQSVTYPVFGNDASIWKDYSPLQRYIVNRTDLSRLTVAYGASDFPYLQQQIVLAAEDLKPFGNTLRTEKIAGLNHMQMVVDFGKNSNRLLNLVSSIVLPQK